MACIIGKLRPFTSALDRDEVDLAVEVKEDYAVGALFALVIMDQIRRLRPHGSWPACLRCCSLESMRVLALDHDGFIRRGVRVPTHVHARRKLEHDFRGALVWIPPHHEHLHSIGPLGPCNGVARREAFFFFHNIHLLLLSL
jgi:hypothetical protein